MFILGVGDGLAQLGLEYHLARIIAGVCEAVYMYSVMRWIVFRDTPRRAADGTRGRTGRLPRRRAKT